MEVPGRSPVRPIRQGSDQGLPSRGLELLRRRGLLLLVASILALALHSALVKQTPNYLVVTGAARNILRGDNPYAPQPGLDFYKYSPLAGLMIAPLLLVPDTLGRFLCAAAQLGLFAWAFWRWAGRLVPRTSAPTAMAVVAFFSTVFDATVSIQNCQVNVGLFALMLLAAAQYAEGRWVRSGLVLSLATNLKLFPFPLGLCLLMGFRKRFWVAFWGGLLLWFGLPALLIGADRNLHLLGEWLDLMIWDQTRNLEMLDVGNFLALHFGIDPRVGTYFALSTGFIIGLGTLALFRKERADLVDRFLLPVVGLYVLLFSYLSESPTSVLATAGIFLIGVEALSHDGRPRLYWVLWVLALILVPIFYTDLIPRAWGEWARGFHLKTLGYLYVTSVVVLILYRRYRGHAGTVGFSTRPVPQS